MVCRLDVQCTVNRCKNEGLKSLLKIEFPFIQKRVQNPNLVYGAKCACKLYLNPDTDEDLKKFVTKIIEKIHNIHIIKNYQEKKYGKIPNYAS